MPTKPSPGMAPGDGQDLTPDAKRQLRESDDRRIPSENHPRPKTKPMMPGEVGA